MSRQPPYPDRDPLSLAAAELAEVVRFHNQAYFVDDAPLIPDQFYDRLVERLRELDPDSDVLQEIGAGAAPGEERVVHATPMLSLGKCYGHDELLHWSREYAGSLVASPKIDGAACAIRYDLEGRFALAATRGDGRQGEPIGRNVIDIPDVPSTLPPALVRRFEGRMPEVRGEVYMRLSRFEAVAALFANPRNVAAGAIKAKEQGGVPASELSFFAYDLLGWPVDSELHKAELLREMGFLPAPIEPCAPRATGQLPGADAVYARILAERSELDYEVDGVVFKMDDIAEQARLGSTAHHPRWAIAWKFQGDSGESRLLEVSFSLSRTGTITPVAIVEPVELSGALVSRATLHNLSNLQRLNLALGDTLLLTRRGGVIPHVEGNKGGGQGVITIPQVCPSCGAPTAERTSLRRVSGEEVATVTLQCTSPATCRAVQREALMHFTRVLRMDGFGEKIVDGLLELRLVSDAAGLYDLDQAALLRLPRMGETLAARLLGQIEAARDVELATLLVALGVETLGRHAAGLLAARWNLEEIRKLDTVALAELHSLGAITAERIVEGLREQSGLLDRLQARLRVRGAAVTSSGQGPLAGEVVVFTGALERSGRRDAQQLVVRNGGRAGSSVTAETTMLVVGGDGLQAERPSSKLKKAFALRDKGDLKILTEEQFHALIG